MSEKEPVEAPEGGDDGKSAIWEELRAQEAGQSDAPPAEAKEDQPKADEPPGKAPADAPPASQDDKWASAPPELREEYERAQARAEEAETLVKRHSGRLSKADHELNELRAQLAAQRDAGGATPKGEEAKDREERLRQLREEYPEVAGPILDLLAEQEAQVRELRGERQAQVETQTEEVLQEQLRTLEQAHPDWADVVGVEVNGQRTVNPDFRDWVEKQPGYIRDAVAANASVVVDGATAADVLSRYKADRGIGGEAHQRHGERRRDQLDALRDTRTKTPAATAKGGAEDPESIWKELQAEDRRKAAARG